MKHKPVLERTAVLGYHIPSMIIDIFVPGILLERSEIPELSLAREQISAQQLYKRARACK